jgi:Asp-tRNA(Asn)/Glu-tRNA(Gln) amidotransferase C subunit
MSMSEVTTADLEALAEAVEKLGNNIGVLEAMKVSGNRWAYHDGRRWRKDDTQPTLRDALIARARETDNATTDAG